MQGDIRVSTSNDDDEDGSFKPGLESIMEASLLDDCGGRRDLFDRIMEHFRSWNSSRDHSGYLGRSENVSTVQVASQKTKPAVLVSTLSRTSR